MDTSEHFVLKIDVLEVGKIGKLKDLSKSDLASKVQSNEALFLTSWSQIPQHNVRGASLDRSGCFGSKISHNIRQLVKTFQPVLFC